MTSFVSGASRAPPARLHPWSAYDGASYSSPYRLIMLLRVSLSALALSVLPALRLWAQTPTLLTETRVNLRRTPSTAERPLRVLPALTPVSLRGSDTTNGFIAVRTPPGDTGWIAVEYLFAEAEEESSLLAERSVLRILGEEAPSSEVSPEWERPPVSRSTLVHSTTGERCGPRGAPGGDGPTLLLKNRNDEPTVSRAVTFDALTGLPYERGGLRGDRTRWTSAQRREVERYEGVHLTVVGYLAAVRPQRSSGEATNCGFTGEPNTDWHMALVRTYRDGEAHSVVVEPTPRMKRRHPNWTKANLAPWTGTERGRADSVRVTGFLFYDPDHANHLDRFRRTMWELHPVTRIEVWQGGRWVDLDDLDGG